MPIPGNPVPSLSLATLNHGQLDLAKDVPENGTVLVFYRGLHCPICIRQLADLESRLDEFTALNLRLVAISADDRARTEKTAEKSAASGLTMAYGLSLQQARENWGLFISAGRDGTTEPALFAEPGLFWVRKDNLIWFSSVQSMPFVRPDSAGLLGGIKYVLANNYPLRGNFTGSLS